MFSLNNSLTYLIHLLCLADTMHLIGVHFWQNYLKHLPHSENINLSTSLDRKYDRFKEIKGNIYQLTKPIIDIDSRREYINNNTVVLIVFLANVSFDIF